MQQVLDFFTKNKDAIGVIGSVLAVVWGAWKLLIRRWWKQRVRIDVTAYEVITDPNVLLPKLLNSETDENPMADHRIPYQPRDPAQNIQEELRVRLNSSRYLLIIAPTGYGKTREAGVLAQTMMGDGWQVFHVKEGWLDELKKFPAQLKRTKILILLDDLNFLFSYGDYQQSPTAEEMPLQPKYSYHDRLLRMLDSFEKICHKSEVRVIATARSEDEQWKALNYKENDSLWKRFEQPVELPPPEISAIVGLLEKATLQAELKADPSDLEAIARESDRTYKRIQLNLHNLCQQNKKSVYKKDFIETLDGTWRKNYEEDKKEHPAIDSIYDAIHILRQSGIELFSFLVEPTALFIGDGNIFHRFLHQREISHAMRYLTKETYRLRQANEKISPSDGQIEVKSQLPDWKKFAPDLEAMLLKASNQFGEILSDSLLAFGESLAQEDHLERAIRIWKQGAEVSQKSIFWFKQGLALDRLGRFDQAEDAYRRALEQDPNNKSAHENLNRLMIQKRNEAKSVCLRAIEKEPNGPIPHYDLGILLMDNDPEGAEAEFNAAITLDPNNALFHYALGNLLDRENRLEEAQQAYNTAIEKDPNNALYAYALGELFNKDNRFEDARDAYSEAIRKDPKNASYHFALGDLFDRNNCLKDAQRAYYRAIKLNWKFADTYHNLDNLLVKQGRHKDVLRTVIPIVLVLLEKQKRRTGSKNVQPDSIKVSQKNFGASGYLSLC